MNLKNKISTGHTLAWGVFLFVSAFLFFLPSFSFAGEADIAGELDLTTFQKLLYQFFTGIGGIAVWFGGTLLDYSITILLVNMGNLLSSESTIGKEISNLWEIIRDLFNLAFIFGLIYLGFKTILRIDESQTRKTLGMIIIAALLINFSLYTTKVVIDFSNLLAFEIYELITPEHPYESALGYEAAGIGGQFLEMTKFIVVLPIFLYQRFI